MSGDNRTRPWAAIHRDYKLTDADGKRWVLVLVEGVGTCLVPWEGLTEPDSRTPGQLPANGYTRGHDHNRR